MSAGPVIVASWDVPPAGLADHLATQLSVDVNLNSRFASSCRGVMRGVLPVGAPGICRFGYAFVMLLAAVAMIPDATDAVLRGHFILRGTLEIVWIQALLRALDGLGLFDQAPSCFEELLVKVQSRLRALAAPLPEQALTSVDFNQALAWVPGHFGAVAAHPWCLGVTFGHYMDQGTQNMLPLFMFCFDVAPFYVRAQVTSAVGPFMQLSKAYGAAVEVYSQGSAYVPGSMPAAEILEAFTAFVVSLTTEDTYLVVGGSAAACKRLLVQRAAVTAGVLEVARGLIR